MCFLLVLALSACAVNPLVTAPTSAPADGAANARRLAERAFPDKPIAAFRQLPGLPFYEIWIDRTLVYTDLDAKVLLLGNLLDGATLANLGQSRLTDLQMIPINEIPLGSAIQTVRGTGRNRVVVFSDPNCSYCKRFEAELKALKDVTLITVIYPVLGPDSLSKSRAILCAPQPEAAWRAWMDHGTPPPAPMESCLPPFEQVLAFGRKHDVGITPTTIFANGKRLAGLSPAVTLQGEITGAQSTTTP